MINIYEQIDRNKLKSNLIVFLFIGFVVAAVYSMLIAFGADTSTVFIAVVMSMIGSIGGYYYSDKIVLSL